MNKKEIGLIIYGFYIIGYFGLSLLAFMADPITTRMNEITAFPIVMATVIGFIVYSILFIRYQKKEIAVDRL